MARFFYTIIHSIKSFDSKDIFQIVCLKNVVMSLFLSPEYYCRFLTLNPKLSTVCLIRVRSTLPVIVACPEARSTSAWSTSGSEASAFSVLVRQWLHLIPSMWIIVVRCDLSLHSPLQEHKGRGVSNNVAFLYLNELSPRNLLYSEFGINACIIPANRKPNSKCGDI